MCEGGGLGGAEVLEDIWWCLTVYFAEEEEVGQMIRYAEELCGFGVVEL